MRRIVDILCLLCLLPATLHAAPADTARESLERIREAAREHVLAQADRLGGHIEVEVLRLDSRLRLAACDRPLETADSPNGLRPGRSVVSVRCTGTRPWKLYVPVRIATIAPVVVSARPLARGQSISAADLRVERRDTSGLHRAYFTRVEALVGRRARRPIPAGRIVHAGLVEQRRLVRRGAPVQIVLRRGPLEVRMKGKALQNGALGDRVEVKNLSSGRRVSGEVAAAGVVRVDP